MALSKIQYKPNETIITAKNLNNIQDEIINLESKKLDKTGGTVTNHIKMDAVEKGYYLKDSTGFDFPAIYNNASNLWVGSIGSDVKGYTGRTIISTGYDATSQTGNKSINIAVPKVDNNGSTLYAAWHDGYINYDKLYPVGSCYTMSTNTNPNTIFPGTSWELIDKKFYPRYVGSSDDATAMAKIFTKNTTNIQAVNYAYVINNDHQVKFTISLSIKVAVGETNLELGNLKLDYLGATAFGFTYVDTCYADGFNGIPLWQVDSEGKIQHIDLINKGDSKTSVTNKETSYIISQVITLNPSRMLDAYCNQFIWKRTA